MIAVVEVQGFQFKVKEGEKIVVPKIEKEVGENVEIDRVLLVENDEIIVGKPIVENYKVKARVLRHLKGKKVIVFKFKKRKRYHVKKGHRDHLTELLIEKIEKQER